MKQRPLRYSFETEVTKKGWMLSSPDSGVDLKIFFESPPENQNVLDMISAGLHIHLLGHGILMERYMVFLENPSMDLKNGGKFSVIIEPRPLEI